MEAAIAVALEEGIMAMTLDGVCKRAGISKGGLVHHYRSKDELLAAMIDRFIGSFEEQLKQQQATEPGGPHRRIRGLLRLVMNALDATPSSADKTSLPHAPMRLMISLLTASANNPVLLTSIRKRFQAMRDAILTESPNDGALDLVVWAAFDGLMLWQHLGVITPADELHRRLLDRMLRLLEPSVKASRKSVPRNQASTRMATVARNKDQAKKTSRRS